MADPDNWTSPNSNKNLGIFCLVKTVYELNLTDILRNVKMNTKRIGAQFKHFKAANNFAKI